VGRRLRKGASAEEFWAEYRETDKDMRGRELERQSNIVHIKKVKVLVPVLQKREPLSYPRQLTDASQAQNTHTYHYTWKIEQVPFYREAKCGRDRGARGFEQHTVGIDRLGGVLKGVCSKVFPVFHDRLILEQL